MSKKIVLSSPHMSGHELQFIEEAYHNNWITTGGPNVTSFETALEDYLGQGCHVACLSSGTAAIHLALILSGVQQGDEVLCQSMTFSASANPIAYQGATPIFVDSESDTWNMCPIHLESAIKDRIKTGKKPKAIIVVHLYGMPSKIDEIAKIASAYNITLVEDAAEALGSTYKNQYCGTFGDYGILSFNGNKIITTSSGGALVTTTKEEKDKAIFFATQARDNAPHYQHSEIGYNYRMSNIVAGIGRGQMEVLETRVSQRRSMNRFYADLFKNKNGITVFKEPNKTYYSNHWLSCVVVDESKAKFSNNNLREAMIQDNIESRPLWKPMHLQPVFKGAPFYGEKTSETLFNNGLCLPSGSNLTEDDKNRIKAVVKKFS